MSDAQKGFQTQTETAAETSSDAIPLKDLKFEEVPLSELGMELPVGLFVDGERLRSFKLYPYKNKFDRVLGQLLNRPKVKLSDVLESFLPQVVESIGGYPIAELAKKMNTSPGRVFTSMLFGDIITLIFQIRIASQGDDKIALSMQCQSCGQMNEDDPKKGIYHTLYPTPVKILPDLSQPLEVEVQLEDGFDPGDGYLVKRVNMKPIKLNAVERIADPKNRNATDIEMLFAMISRIPDSELFRNSRGQVFSESLYDELGMRDTALMREAIEALQPGPELTIEFACNVCGFDNDVPIPWRSLRQFLYVATDTAE